MPNPTRADVAARRITHRQQQPERQPERDVDERDEQPDDDPQRSPAAPGTIPSRMIPKRRRSAATTIASTSADDREPGRELAVDHVVAVDRLRQQPRQRALGPLAVDRVEREREAEQRRRRARRTTGSCTSIWKTGTLTPSWNRARNRAGGRSTCEASGPDLLGGEVQRDPRPRGPGRSAGRRTGSRAGGRRTPCRRRPPSRERGTDRATGPGRRLRAGVGRRGRRRGGAAASAGVFAAVMPRLRGPARSGRPPGGRCPRGMAGRTGPRPAGSCGRAVARHDRVADLGVALAIRDEDVPRGLEVGLASATARDAVDPADDAFGRARRRRLVEPERELDLGAGLAEAHREIRPASPARSAGRRRRCRSGRRPPGPG